MKVIIEKGETYEFLPELQGGYYSPNGWHHYKRAGKLVYNIDESFKKFYNKVTEEEIKTLKNNLKSNIMTKKTNKLTDEQRANMLHLGV